MKVGDLVYIRQDIPQYVEFYGKSVGIVIEVNEKECPKGIKVWWESEGFEQLYSDEVDIISQARKT